MVRPPLNCRRMYVGADAPTNAFLSGLTQQITLQWRKVKHFSTRKKSYKKYRNYFGKTLDIKALVW